MARGGEWTGDDILLAAAETYAILPRPPAPVTDAFLIILRDGWPAASAGARLAIAQTLRGSRRVSRRVLDALEACEMDAVADTAADRAREALRALAGTAEPGPELQPATVLRRLRDARDPALELADLLRLPPGGARLVVRDARGLLVALKALGVEPEVARGFVARWHAAVPPGFAEAYAALTLEECLDIVAAWRGAALHDVRGEARRTA